VCRKVGTEQTYRTIVSPSALGPIAVDPDRNIDRLSANYLIGLPGITSWFMPAEFEEHDGKRVALKLYFGPGVEARSTGTDAETWATLTAALGLTGARVGQSWSVPSGAPSLSGVVAYLAKIPYDALLRLDTLGPGVGAFGAVTYPGGHSVVAMNLYLSGDQAPETVVRETLVWQAWLEQRFPMPTESSVSE